MSAALRIRPLTPLLLLLLLVSSACSTFREGARQAVQVNSLPLGANVFLAGTLVGQTPLTLDLGGNVPHELVIEKAGYRPYTQHVMPELSQRGRTVRLGPLDQAGVYNDLKPNPVEAHLIPDFLPERPGPFPYEEMTQLLQRADHLLANGSISREEHRHITQQIANLYLR